MATENLLGATGGGKTRVNAYTEYNREALSRVGEGVGWGTGSPGEGSDTWPGSWVTVITHYWNVSVPAEDGWNIQSLVFPPPPTPELAAWVQETPGVHGPARRAVEHSYLAYCPFQIHFNEVLSVPHFL